MISDCETHITKFANSTRFIKDSNKNLLFKVTLREKLPQDIQLNLLYNKQKKEISMINKILLKLK